MPLFGGIPGQKPGPGRSVPMSGATAFAAELDAAGRGLRRAGTLDALDALDVGGCDGEAGGTAPEGPAGGAEAPGSSAREPG